MASFGYLSTINRSSARKTEILAADGSSCEMRKLATNLVWEK